MRHFPMSCRKASMSRPLVRPTDFLCGLQNIVEARRRHSDFGNEAFARNNPPAARADLAVYVLTSVKRQMRRHSQ